MILSSVRIRLYPLIVWWTGGQSLRRLSNVLVHNIGMKSPRVEENQSNKGIDHMFY